MRVWGTVGEEVESLGRDDDFEGVWVEHLIGHQSVGRGREGGREGFQ